MAENKGVTTSTATFAGMEIPPESFRMRVSGRAASAFSAVTFKKEDPCPI